jgi:NodT family efflux transporter outer membrane factor (OMF) lipoprotein
MLTFGARGRYLNRLVAGFFGLPLMLSACTSVGPDFSPPAASVASGWIASGDRRLTADAPNYRDWWRVFDDPILESLIGSAYRQNLPLQIAGVRVFEARAQLGVAVGNTYPQSQQGFGALDLNRVSERDASAPQGSASNRNFLFAQNQFGVSAAWELDFWGKFRRGIESADANLLSAIAAYDNALVLLTSDVASRYVAIRTLQERLKIARDNVQTQQASLKIAEARFRDGATSERDVQQALTQLRATESTIPQLQVNLVQAKNALSILLGLPPVQLEPSIDVHAPIPMPTAATAGIGVPADLLRRRPDLRQAEFEAARQSALIGVAKADLYPAISLSGSFGFVSTDVGRFDLADVFLWKSRAGSIGPAFQWNVLNYGRITNAVRVQDARLQAALITYQNAVLQAQREVEDGLIAFLKANETVKSLSEAVAAARRSTELAVIQYREGATDYTTVITAQQALLDQQDNLAVNQGNIPLGLISVYRALGGGWEIRESQDLIEPSVREAMMSRTDWGGLLEPDVLEPLPPSTRDALFRAPNW